MGKVHLTGFLICRTLDEADRVSRMLPEHVRLTRSEPGCLKFEILRSHADPTRFAVNETFRDRGAFDAHQQRTQTSDWWAATRHIPREFEITED
jgi:quinol monooxygenase YgiN